MSKFLWLPGGSLVVDSDRYQSDDKCRRHEQRLQTETGDRFIRMLWDREKRRYELWRFAPNGSKNLLFTIEAPNGDYLDPDDVTYRLPQRLADGDLARHSPDDIIRRAQDAQDAHRREEMRKVSDQVRFSAEYTRKALTTELDGSPIRHGVDDVMDGLRSALGAAAPDPEDPTHA